MSKADEMLSNEYFETFYYNRFINSYHKNLLVYIQFDKKKHTVEILGKDADKYFINIFLYSAINEKVKELGGIE